MALERYGVPPQWIEIVKAYYSGIWSRSFSSDAPSGWHQHLRGIFQGCTASIILFLVAMNIVIEYICLGAVLQDKPSSLPVKAFMDDLFLKAKTLNEAQGLLDRANFVLSWARMKVKPSKSKSLVIVKGVVQNDKFLKLSTLNKSENIPSISTNPVRFLGRYITYKVNDKHQAEEFSQTVSKGLSLIDKSCHRGIEKVWILQHLLVPRLRWPLLIYEIPITIVIRLEQKISCFVRKWLKLHNSTTNLCLYSSSLFFLPSPLKKFI